MSVDVFSLQGSITLELGQFKKAVAEAKREGEQLGKNFQGTGKVMGSLGDAASNLGSHLGDLASKMKDTLVKAAKVAAAALGAAETAVTALTKSAVSSFGEYEQLVGGVDTLFGKSSAKVQQYADEAYKTAGMSANEYMQTVTSFSASLLQGLGGDTDKAADIADRAIRDMSDNANKMGTDMQAIQNAYQGFAKQNYVMLDNLKLGRHYCSAA